jgi:hypothetical protein
LKKPIIFIAALGLMALGSHAFADHHQPTFGLGPGAAHLAAAKTAVAPTAERFVLRQDPSGAPMCFDASGAKAPLSSCEQAPEDGVDAAEHILALDPSGAPMCFDTAGLKAPLAACESAIAALATRGGMQLASR